MNNLLIVVRCTKPHSNVTLPRPKPIEIRPHHFLCLPGYEGISYDLSHKNHWDKFSEIFNQRPNTPVKIVEGKDDLCLNCPNNGKNKYVKCNEKALEILDKRLQNILNLKINKIYSYKQILNKLKEILDPQKHKELCGDCYSRTLGLCKDTFKKNVKSE